MAVVLSRALLRWLDLERGLNLQSSQSHHLHSPSLLYSLSTEQGQEAVSAHAGQQLRDAICIVRA